MNSLRVMAALLTYPSKELQGAADELKAALKSETFVGPKTLSGLNQLIDYVAETDLMELEESYVLFFDRTRSLSLNLFEHVYGDSRNRGEAMVELQKTYDAHGLMLDSGELPDFLPAFLEFLSMLAPEAAREELGRPLHVITVLAERLEKRKSPYAIVLRALEEFAAARPNQKELAVLQGQIDDDPDDFEAIDKIWNESPVEFGSGGSCSKLSDVLSALEAEQIGKGNLAEIKEKRS